MQILILNGSPRKKGNTEQIVTRIAEDVNKDGDEVELFRLADLDIHPCIGCGHCEKAGICIFKDDMQLLYEKIAEADRIILASPIYFYGLTAQAKTCVDRCQALWSRKYILKKSISSKPGRKGYLISVAATKGERVFEGAILTARYGLDAMDVRYSCELLFPGVDGKGTIKNHPDYPAAVHTFIQLLLEN